MCFLKKYFFYLFFNVLSNDQKHCAIGVALSEKKGLCIIVHRYSFIDLWHFASKVDGLAYLYMKKLAYLYMTNFFCPDKENAGMQKEDVLVMQTMIQGQFTCLLIF